MLGTIVFKNSNKREKLDSFTHPRIIEKAKQRENEILKVNPDAIIVHNVPLLFEAGINKNVDITVAVHVDEGKQMDRLIQRDGISEAEARNRIKAHLSSAKKKERADYIIDNNGSPEETKRQVRKLYSRFCALAAGKSN